MSTATDLAADAVGPLPSGMPRSGRLTRILAAVADAVTPDEVFRAVVDRVAAVLGASSAALWQVRAGDRTARLARAVGYSDLARRAVEAVSLDDGPALPGIDVIRWGGPIFIGSQAELIEAYPHLSAIATAGRSYRIACVPVFSAGQPIGSLALTFDDAPPLQEEETAILLLVARYAGHALERLRLLAGERASRLRAELLHGLARALISADRAEVVFQAALDAIERALGTNRAAILSYDPDGVMRFREWRGLSARYRQAVEGHSPWPRDARDPEPLVIDDALNDPAWAAYRELFTEEGIGALGFIPLVVEGRLLGKFMVYYPTARRLDVEEMALARGIADHVAAAISRFETLAELRETVRFNELVTGILGHDLRNPLAAILTATGVAARRDQEGKVSAQLARIRSSGERMTRMIDQLLDLTRVRLGSGIPLSATDVDLVSLIRQTLDELEAGNPGASLQLQHRGDPHGRWDGDRLGQVFSNLVANAVQHGDPAAGVGVTVDGEAPDSLVVEVRNGGTIPSALLPTLFEPFAGTGQRSPKSRGLGLGLYITRELVRAHAGEIQVRSDEEVGTVFRVLLPRRPR